MTLYYLSGYTSYRASPFLWLEINTSLQGYSQKNWVGVRGLLPKPLTLFKTKICDFPYSIYELTENLIFSGFMTVAAGTVTATKHNL